MRPLRPVVLWGGAATLAVAGAGLLLPLGGTQTPDPAADLGAQSAGGSALPASTRSAAAAASAAAAPTPPAASPSASTPAGSATGDTTGAVTAAPAPPGAPQASPADRLAGPVPDDEIALAFAAAVPAQQDLDPAVAAEITSAASAGLVDWYDEAGWRDIRVQAAVVTEITTVPPAAAATASVAALWSGDHPVLGGTDRRYATVTLATVTGETPTADGPGTAWAVDSIRGGADDG